MGRAGVTEAVGGGVAEAVDKVGIIAAVDGKEVIETVGRGVSNEYI